MAATVPEQGQVVQVRHRRYVVTTIQQRLLPQPLLATPIPLQHVVTLQALEEDSLGEELQVVWELEVGAQVVNQRALPAPDGFDAPQRFDAFLDAVRWGTVASANTRALQAPFRSGIAIEDYQLDPVVRAIQMPRANLLIADDVGLGKTVETGLVMQELMVRQRVRTVLIVCPSALQIQWRDQMREKFGLSFRIVDSALMRTLRRERGLHVNPWSHYPLLITSIDFLKRDRPMRLMRETLPADDTPRYPRRFDLLVIDEVHNVAPSGRGQYAVDSLRTLAIRQIAPHFEHRLFLSATPHNGYAESFSALLELLDNQRFARGVMPDRQQLQTIMVRRLKSDITAWDGSPRFPQRVVVPLEVHYREREREAHRILAAYSRERLHQARDASERVATEFVLKLLKKRLFSSPEAFALTLEQHERTLHQPKKPVAQRAPSISVLRQHLADIDDEDLEDETPERDDGLTVAATFFAPLTAIEREYLQQLRQWAAQARVMSDSRLEMLMAWLRQHIQIDGVWTDQRVVIFTEYRATQRWLMQLLATHGFGQPDRIALLYGGMAADQRERIKAAFQADPALAPVRILLATDAASEGIDLQKYCSHLIHMEIPWNPSRLEQRNGRIDRHGQHAKSVQIYHFVSHGWQHHDATTPGSLEADLEFLFRAAQKVNTIREDLGKVGPVIAAQVEEAMLGQRRSLDTTVAETQSAPVRALLKFERSLREHIQLLHEQLHETQRTLQLTPDRIKNAVDVALALANLPGLEPVANDDGVFWMPALTGSWAEATMGLAHPHTQAIRPITFDHERARDRDDVVLVHLNHRLVQMALRLLRAEVWATNQQQRLFRVTARTAPNAALDTPALIACARLVMLGGDQQRLHEELVLAGGWIRDGRWTRMSVADIERVIGAMQDQAVVPSVAERLRSIWPQYEAPLLTALDARVHDRTTSLQRQLRERADHETHAMQRILSELEQAIRQKLHAFTTDLQLSLFSNPEKEQVARNQEALRLRLQHIPAERDHEIQAIADRFANPQPRFFPVATLFIVPERLNR